MLLLGCIPIQGREGVTLISAADNREAMGKRGFQQSQKFIKFRVQGSVTRGS